MSGMPAVGSGRLPAVAGSDLLVDVLIGVVLFVVVIAVAAVLMALMQVVLPGESDGGAPHAGGSGGVEGGEAPQESGVDGGETAESGRREAAVRGDTEVEP